MNKTITGTKKHSTLSKTLILAIIIIALIFLVVLANIIPDLIRAAKKDYTTQTSITLENVSAVKNFSGKILSLYKALFWSPGYVWKVLLLVLIGGYITYAVVAGTAEWAKILPEKKNTGRLILCSLKGFVISFKKIFIFIKESFKWLLVSLILAAFLLGIGQVSEWVLVAWEDITLFKQEIQEIIDNQQRLKELKAIAKNLSNTYINAKIQVLDVDKLTGEAHFRFSVMDQTANNPEKTPLAVKEFSLPDADIYLDFYVCNFDYSEIGEGLKNNIAVPYRLYSSSIAPIDAIQLLDDGGIPLFFARDEQSLFGIDLETYNAQIGNLSENILDGDKARRSGILRYGDTVSANTSPENSSVRSSSGSAVHRTFMKGDKYTVQISNQGGIILKKDAVL